MISWDASSPEAAGERLDRHVAARLDLPATRSSAGSPTGSCGSTAARPSLDRASPPATRRVLPRRSRRRSGCSPSRGDLRVLYEDAELVVLDKPAGLTVHPGAGRPTGTLAHQLLDRYPEMAGVGGPGRPGIVHRLDQGTSGVLVVARTAGRLRPPRPRLRRPRGREALSRRSPTARPTPPAGTIEAPIGRHPQQRKEMAVRPAAGRRAPATARSPPRRRDRAARDRPRHRPHAPDPRPPEARSAIRWSAIRSTARRAGRRSPAPSSRSCATSPAPPSTPGGSPSHHPATGEPLAFEAPVPEDLRELWEGVAGGAFPVNNRTGS